MFNPYVALCKFSMALLVVAIHVEPFTGNAAFYYNHCLARIADPMFFTLSAYFLFDKLLCSDWELCVFFKQIKRLCLYYGMWLMVYSPVILSRTWARTEGGIDFIWQVLRQIFLSGPYGALWFLPALILGLILTYWIGKRTSPLLCLMISCPFFLLTVVQMEYFHFIKDIGWLTAINNFFVSIFGWLGNGINYGFFFCAMGLFIASKKGKSRFFRRDVILCVLFMVMLVVECTIIRHFKFGISYGAMLMLIPVTYYLMQVVLRIPKEVTKHSSQRCRNTVNAASSDTLHTYLKHLQDMSLLIFPLHYGIMELLEHLLYDEGWYMNSTTLQYAIVILVTCVLSNILLLLGKRIRFFRLFYGK